MLNFKHNDWENGLTLTCDVVSVLIIENKQKFWQYLQELIRASEGEPTDFVLYNEKYDNQSIAKYCVTETNLAGLTLNSKRLTTALYKKCGGLATEPENEYQFRKQIKALYDTCKQISLDMGYDVTLSEDFEPADVFKLFALEIKENYKSILEKLTAYVNINIELLKTKVFVILFLEKFLNDEELKRFVEHCETQEVSLLLIEDSLPKENYLKEIPCRIFIIDDDDCEILKK
jgi:CRISPR type II-A-associated protein Csn2